MEDRNIYSEIGARTDGDIYIGVVGPVRTGKSTFIKRFMETLVLPNIPDGPRRERAVDELPQSAAGRTIMTTEPKFVPEEAVEIHMDESAVLRVRMVDCVGYIVPSSLGYIEEDQPRMVVTPWFERPIPFNMAAEIGTRKVINDHSTIGLVVTTDGSISDIPRAEYQEAEERVIAELQEIGKPFVVLLNCVEPRSTEAQDLREELAARYEVPVIALSCPDLEEEDIRMILAQVLYQFPVREVAVELPGWIVTLPGGHWLKNALYGAIREGLFEVNRISELPRQMGAISDCEHVDYVGMQKVDFGTGKARMQIAVKSELFFRVLCEATGMAIQSESELIPLLMDLVATKNEYEKYRGALEEVSATGYGIVMPTTREMSLETPEIVKQGGRYGVRLRASAPSIHMMRADISTEVSPIVGSEQQSEDLVSYLMEEFETDPIKIWNSNIFGKSLQELVSEGVRGKLYRMPPDARLKLQETIERVVNEGCSGLICIIL